MRNRVVILAAAAFVLLAVQVMAQTAPATPRAFGMAMFMNVMATVKEVGLTPEQMQQMGDVFKKFGEDVKPIAQSSAPDKHDQMMALWQTAMNAAIGKLTPPQQAKMRSIPVVQLMLEPKNALPKVLIAMNFSDAQKETAKQIFTDAKAKAAEIQANKGQDPAANKQVWMSFGMDIAQKVLNALTPEQKQTILNSVKPQQ